MPLIHFPRVVKSWINEDDDKKHGASLVFVLFLFLNYCKSKVTIVEKLESDSIVIPNTFVTTM